MHSWIFRNRRRLERLYGLAPSRPEEGARRSQDAEAEDERCRAGRAGERTREIPAPLPARVLVPRPRRVA